MNSKYRELLNIIQTDFPLESRPYAKLADQLGITENQIISMIRELKESGDIKRIGGIFNSKELGYHSTLCAAHVPEEKIFEVAEMINRYDGVTHNYIRNHYYNMWFTIIAPSIEYIDNYIENIRQATGIKEIINLPSVKLFKVNVNFELKE